MEYELLVMLDSSVYLWGHPTRQPLDHFSMHLLLRRILEVTVASDTVVQTLALTELSKTEQVLPLFQKLLGKRVKRFGPVEDNVPKKSHQNKKGVPRHSLNAH